MKSYSILLGCLILSLVSCSPDAKIVEIYTSGMRFDTVSSTRSYEGIYWKSLAMNIISNPTPPIKKFAALDITMEGDDLYVLGLIDMYSYTDDSIKTVFWKNGIVNYLNRGAVNSEGTDIFVEHGDVYVLVNDNFANLINVGYYKNGIYVPVSSTQGIGKRGEQLFVHNDTVYIAGYQYTGYYENTRPRLWKDDVEITLSSPDIIDGRATDVIVAEDGTTYVTGAVTPNLPIRHSTPVYWRNGVYTPLTLSSGYVAGSANCIFIENSNIYIGGVQYDTAYNTSLTYWKNGSPVIIDSGIAGRSTVSKIAVLDDKVYCIGFKDYKNSAALWINGARIDIGSRGFQTYVNGLFVKYHD